MGVLNTLVVDGTRVRDVKHAILKKIQDDEDFLDSPIVVVDIPRQLSNVVQSSSFYVSLEEIQRNFHSGKYNGGQVVWTVPPKVIVFANCTPATDKLSSDRLQVYKISPVTFDMRKDSIIDAQLVAQSLEFQRLDALREKAIDNAPEIQLADTQTCFEVCFSLSTSTPALLAERLHHSMRRAGYNQSKKAMNRWIREHFEQEIRAGVVREISQSNRVAWKGFKPATAQPQNYLPKKAGRKPVRLYVT